MISRKDVISDKVKKLEELRSKSTSALDLVTSTINNLAIVNEEIDVVISEIGEAKQKLEDTEVELNNTKDKNGKIISKFRSLIEE